MKLVTRAEWGARAPRTITRLNSSTVKGVGIHWEGPKMGAFPHTACDDKVRGIQNYHMNNQGWADIAYSHLVCPHGYIFEGRKWGVRTAANGTNHGNTYYHAICYLGGEGDPFTAEAKAALKEYIGRHKSVYGDEVRPHSFFKATACPGNVIRKWLADGLPLDNPTPAPCDQQVFRHGSTGECVKEIQRELNKHGASLVVDGGFGDNTDRAVRVFQQDKGLGVDGVVGPNTWRALKADPAPPPEDYSVVVTASTDVDQILAYQLAKRWGFAFLPSSELANLRIGYVVAVGYQALENSQKGLRGGVAVAGGSRWDTADAVLGLVVGPTPNTESPWKQ